MIFLLDNYDSFTYNLYQYLSELGEDVVVDRNDKTTVENIAEMQPEKIVISPGRQIRQTRESPRMWRGILANAARRCWACASGISASARCLAEPSPERARSCTANPA